MTAPAPATATATAPATATATATAPAPATATATATATAPATAPADMSHPDPRHDPCDPMLPEDPDEDMTDWRQQQEQEEEQQMLPTQKRLRELFLYIPNKGIFIRIKKLKYNNTTEKQDMNAGNLSKLRNYQQWVIRVDGKQYKRSRLAFMYVTGHWPQYEIDHINGNSLDDRWCNLREATHQQNSWNMKAYKKKSLLPPGVRKSGNKFQSRIKKNDKTYYLGTFYDEKDAAIAYRKARQKLFGKWASTSHPVL